MLAASNYIDTLTPWSPSDETNATSARLGSLSVAGDRTEQAGLGVTGFERPRYPRILVAIDETPAAAFALRHVVPYAVDQRSHLTLVSVAPNPPVWAAAAGVSPQQLADQMETAAATRLREIAATLPQDLSVTTVLRHGDPAEEILALLREQPFDVLCMGARGRGRVTGALLGSVSTAVLHHSPVPVIVLHPPRDAGNDN
jgi:nucleotide-binding universal stress UspA family protein